MTQIWMDGFDHYGDDVDNMLDGAWAAFVGAGSTDVTLSTAFSRTGAHSLHVVATGGTLGETVGIRRALDASYSELFVGWGLYMPELPEINSIFGPLQFRTSGNLIIASLTVDANGGATLRSGDLNGSSLGSTNGPVFVAGTWHHVECRIVRDGAAGIFELRVDEVVVLSLTGLNLGATDIGQLALVGKSFVQASVTPNMYFDDLIVRNASGSTNNTFMGDLRVATLQPIANGVNQGWATRSISKLGVGVMNFQDSNRNETVAYADNAVFEIGSGDFCIEQFVRFDNLLTTAQTATISSKHRGSTDERSWRLRLHGPDVGGTLNFTTSSDGTAGDEIDVHAFPFIPEVDRWYHIAVSRSGTDSRMFIDGQQVGVTQTDSRTYDDNTSKLFVNSSQDGVSTVVDNSGIDGWVDGVRFTVGVARYTANFTPPITTLPDNVGDDPLYNSVELLLNFDSSPTVLDESANAFTAELINSPSVEFPDDASAFQNIDGLTPSDNNFVEASLVAAEGTLTFTANPLDTETVTLGGTTYTFQTVLVDAADNVLIGVDAETSLDNLLAAVNLEAGVGTLYGTGTVQNVDAFMADLPNLQVLATARTPGAAGNSIASTETVTGGSWDAATLSGGSDIPANSEFTVSQLPPEVTGVRSLAIIGRNFKTDSGSSELTMSYVEQGGSSAAGAARPVTVNPTYYEDTFEQDPNTLGALTPSSVLNARIRLNRTL